MLKPCGAVPFHEALAVGGGTVTFDVIFASGGGREDGRAITLNGAEVVMAGAIVTGGYSMELLGAGEGAGGALLVAFPDGEEDALGLDAGVAGDDGDTGSELLSLGEADGALEEAGGGFDAEDADEGGSGSDIVKGESSRLFRSSAYVYPMHTDVMNRSSKPQRPRFVRIMKERRVGSFAPT